MWVRLLYHRFPHPVFLHCGNHVRGSFAPSWTLSTARRKQRHVLLSLTPNMTPYEKAHLLKEVCGGKVASCDAQELDCWWLDGISLGRDSKIDEHFVGTDGGIVRARAIRGMGYLPRFGVSPLLLSHLPFPLPISSNPLTSRDVSLKIYFVC